MNETFKIIENEKVVAEFTTMQAACDYLVNKTKRDCDAHYILSQRGIHKKIKNKWFFIGIILGELIMTAVHLLSKYAL